MATRIYADFNGLVGEAGKSWAVGLDTYGSLQALANAGLSLSEGLPLVIYDWSDEDEDLEADAIARFDATQGIWWADIGSEGYRFVPKGKRDESGVFLCIACRKRLDEHIRKSGLQIGDVCPFCATRIHEPLMPPAGTSALASRGLTKRPAG